ncbi:MAG: S8 family peptidase [Acidimicrobiaceae bacterium]|nr:S8 family peptidase [Acidimicrobiaceae bacterium]
MRPEPDAIDLAQRYAEALRLHISPNSLRFDSRFVVWGEASWEELSTLPFNAVPICEIRRPAVVDTVEDLTHEEQYEYVDDLVARVGHAGAVAPAVCLLDTGVRGTHTLLKPALGPSGMFTVVPGPQSDQAGHGTKMAGLALFGPLDELLAGSQRTTLLHGLESVKIIPDSSSSVHAPELYGLVTAEAVALPEIQNPERRRVFSLPVTSEPDRAGEPSLWSAAVDAIAAGTDIGSATDGIELLELPDDAAKRLMIVSAGNVAAADYMDDYISVCDTSPIEDPAQAWNALTVGAYTKLVDRPSDPSFAGWEALAEAGDISPHSRTGVTAGGQQWPIKPDICMEGGNVLTDGAGDFQTSHPVVSLCTTGASDDRALSSANATSAATSLAARLAARAMATYPDYWPETIRGLLVHAAEWTPTMKSSLDKESAKSGRRQLLRRFGWGVPADAGVRFSARNAVTMVVQDTFVPFSGPDHKLRHFRLHELPWPAQELLDLGAEDVELRVTLSYFVEPSPARRGWRRRYSYASHGLRFELQAPNESLDSFVRRVNREATVEESGTHTGTKSPDNWLLGPNQRNRGSLHQDIWRGHGAELATTGTIAVHAVGGWWKNNRRADRTELPVRYALLVSLRTRAQAVDLYTPIAVALRVPVAAAAVET